MEPGPDVALGLVLILWAFLASIILIVDGAELFGRR
jgi:hypothetical protein